MLAQATSSSTSGSSSSGVGSSTNPYAIPKTALLTVECPSLLGLVGYTHKKCMGHPDAICNPSDQTDCSVW